MALGDEVAVKNDPEDEPKDRPDASSLELKKPESSTNHERTEPVPDVTEAYIDVGETKEDNQSDESPVSEDNLVEGEVTTDVKDEPVETEDKSAEIKVVKTEEKPVEREDKPEETEMVETEDKPVKAVDKSADTVKIEIEEKSIETEDKPEEPELFESEDKQGETEVVEESTRGEEAEKEESVPAEEEEEEDEEELQDPMDDIREQCKTGSEAVKMAQILEECTERVSSRSNTDETCHQEVIDFMHAVDHCMAKSVFSKLK